MESTVRLSDKCDLLLKPTSKYTVHFVNFLTKNFLGFALLYSTQTCICTVVGTKTHLKRRKNIHHQTNQPINQTIPQSPLLPCFKLLGETNREKQFFFFLTFSTELDLLQGLRKTTLWST